MTVYVKDGKVVGPDDGGERLVIGDAVVDRTGTRLFISDCPEVVKASLQTDDGASFSIGHIFREGNK